MNYNAKNPYSTARFKQGVFEVTEETAEGTYVGVRKYGVVEMARRGSGSLEETEAEEFKPVSVRYPGEKFGRAFADAFGMFATSESAVIEEEA